MAERPTPTVWIGWQGIRVQVPADWTIGQISGEGDDGSMRVDAPDMPRLQIKWKKRGTGSVDVDRTVEDYLKTLTKGRKRNEPAVEVQLGGKYLSRRKKRKAQVRCFSWRGEQQAIGAAWHCTDCDRTVVCQVLGDPDEDLEELAQDVLLSVEDHPDNGWVLWGTYGLECWTPQEFALADQKLMAGLLELRLDRDTERITIRRWGMSDVALRGTDLQTWVGEQLAKGLKTQEWRLESTEYRGHEALRLVGRPRFVWQRTQRFFHHVALKPFGSALAGLIWHCAPEKKIFCVECLLDDENLALADEVCERVVCHRPPDTFPGRERR